MGVKPYPAAPRHYPDWVPLVKPKVCAEPHCKELVYYRSLEYCSFDCEDWHRLLGGIPKHSDPECTCKLSKAFARLIDPGILHDIGCNRAT